MKAGDYVTHLPWQETSPIYQHTLMESPEYIGKTFILDEFTSDSKDYVRLMTLDRRPVWGHWRLDCLQISIDAVGLTDRWKRRCLPQEC